MATSKKAPGDGDKGNPLQWVGRLHGSVSELKKRAAQEKKSRESAPRILRPNQVLGAQDLIDAAGVLETTLGTKKGKQRPITDADLRKFRNNIAAAQKKFTRAGITPQQIIDLSLDIDRQRARDEIKVSMPIRSKNGVVQYMTNASPQSNLTRHHVTVQFLSFEAAVAAGKRTARSAADWLRKEPIRFDCDCGRHTFWYRYVASIGGFAYGRTETGYPKIRNPKLVGVACKHVLRTMAQVLSGAGSWGFLTKMIESARNNDFARSNHKATQAEYEAEAKRQQGRSTSRLEVKTSLSREASKSMRNALAKSVKKAPSPKRASGGTKAMVGKNANQTIKDFVRQYHQDPKAMEQVLRALGLQVQTITPQGKKGKG